MTKFDGANFDEAGNDGNQEGERSAAIVMRTTLLG